MNISGANNNPFANMIPQAIIHNTISHIADARKSDDSDDIKQIQDSIQNIRDQKQETGIDFIAQKIQEQIFETYNNIAKNRSDTSDDKNAIGIFNFIPTTMNETNNTEQKRNFMITAYENSSEISESGSASPKYTINIYA